MAEKILSKLAPNMQALSDAYLQVFKTLLNDRIKECREINKQNIDAMTNYQYFHDEGDLLQSYRDKVKKNDGLPSILKQESIVLTRHVICQYYEKSLLGLCNLIPTTVGYQMVERTLKSMTVVLTNNLEMLATQVAETDQSADERNRLRDKIKRLNLAKNELEKN